MRYVLPVCLAFLLASCGEKPDPADEFHLREVTLPGGRVVKVQIMFDQLDMMRGLMFRKSLADDHGMLFIHEPAGHFTYWMYQTLIPLDMIWMDSTHNIVEIVENAQPCKTQASQCQKYGGNQTASYVLELAGGMVKKYGLKMGDTIQW